MTVIDIPTEPAVSERLADFVVSLRYEDLPSEVVEKTKDLLFNHMALAFAGRVTTEGKRGLDFALRLSGGRGDAILVGERQRVAMLDAIFAHSMLIGHDQDDYTISNTLHIGRIAQPVAWVLGNLHQVSGRELITAVALSYDVAGCLSFPRQLRSYLFLPQNAFAPLAAAAVAAKLLRFDKARASHALAYAAHLGAGLVEGSEVPTSGIMARNGVMAALLAEPRTRGLRALESPHGLFTRIFERPPAELDAGLATLGREFCVMETSTKPYRGSATHALGQEFTKKLMDQESLTGDDIREVVVTLGEDFSGRFAYLERIDRPDATDYDASRSLRLKLAALIAHGNLEPVPTLKHLADPEVRRALPKIRLCFDERPLDNARVQIALVDGRHVELEGALQPYPKGDWGPWLRQSSQLLLSEQKFKRLVASLENLQDVGDVSTVMECVIPDVDPVA